MYNRDRPITTEWEDIFKRRAGEKTRGEEYDEKKKYQAEVEQEIIDALGELKYDGISDSELDELEDELSDEMFRELKAKQLAELEKKKKLSRFGSLDRIKREDYTPTVKDTTCNTVVLIHDESSMESRIVENKIRKLAVSFPYVHFVVIDPAEATAKPGTSYPTKLCPTAIIYIRGAPSTKLIGMMDFGGRNASVEETAELLKRTGVLKHAGAVEEGDGLGDDEYSD